MCRICEHVDYALRVAQLSEVERERLRAKLMPCCNEARLRDQLYQAIVWESYG